MGVLTLGVVLFNIVCCSASELQLSSLIYQHCELFYVLLNCLIIPVWNVVLVIGLCSHTVVNFVFSLNGPYILKQSAQFSPCVAQSLYLMWLCWAGICQFYFLFCFTLITFFPAPCGNDSYLGDFMFYMFLSIL